MDWKRSMLALCAATAVLATVAQAETVGVRFYGGPDLTYVSRDVPPGQSPVEAAVRSLLAGPTAEEQGRGLVTAIPAGTTLVSMEVAGDTITIDLSTEVRTGLDEERLWLIFNQFRTTLGDFPEFLSIRLTHQGQLLSTYLDPAPHIRTAPPPTDVVAPQHGTFATGLSGRVITIGPSHGRIWTGSTWAWLRSDPCGFGEAVLEDTNSIRLCQFLYQYLTQDGAIVNVPRELNESNCCHSGSGLAWWKMAARYWLQHNGLPASVWDTSTSDTNDDIRARPLFADYVGSHIYISHHTNAGGGTGTETFRDTAMEHPAHVTNSLNLANAVQNSVVSTIREMVDANWANRGVKDAAGGSGEIRIPNQPAILIELAFHDHCTRDAVYLQDNFFRSVAEWAIYKGVCQYFGVTPTWDRYSCEFVSDTIPTTMTAGQTYNVSVTFRNRGVVWSNARNFRLGAVDDSDPFTSFNRVNISGEVKPGQTYTFNFQMTAPAAGVYTTDWRMVRDGTAWFGPTRSKSITVTPSVPDDEPPTVPTQLVATATSSTSVKLTWTASTDNVAVAGYDIRRNGSIIGSSTTNSYTDNTVSAGTNYTYEVRARDFTPNYSDFSSPASVTTPVAPVIVFSDGFNGSLSNWTQTSGKEFAYSTAQNHGTYPGGGAAYMAAGESDQMYHAFARPFAQGKASGYFYDSLGGWKGGVCGQTYRQALSLRDNISGVGFILDNCFYSPSASQNYFFRTVGAGGIGYTAYGTRNPNTNCSGAWIYFESTVTPGAPGASPTGTFVVKVTDGAGTSTSTQNLTSDFFSFGIGRITLGLGVSSAGQGWWDDIAFEATPPNAPTMGTPTAGTTQITWTFSRADNYLFGFDVADANGTIRSPSYSASGWLQRTATSWTETGLTANTSYTRKVRAWNGTLNGPWSNPTTAWTLSVAPTAGTITCSAAPYCLGEDIEWTATTGFGPGSVAYYRYAWNQNETYTFTGEEEQWSGGTLVVQPNAHGDWWLHVQGFNGADVANGTYKYKVTVGGPLAIVAQPQIARACLGATTTISLQAVGAAPLSYEWFKDDAPLAADERISGADTNTLQIANATAADAGSYRCVVTDGCGEQVSSDTVVLTLSVGVPPDFDGDCDVDQDDLDHFQACMTGPEVKTLAAGCENTDLDGDGDADQSDFGLLQRCLSGENTAPDATCWAP